jgi:hypothetical protein
MSSPRLDPPPNDGQRFRRTLVRVLAVQVVSLIALWLLQTRFTH